MIKHIFTTFLVALVLQTSAQQFKEDTKFIAVLGSANGLYVGDLFYGGNVIFEMGFRPIGSDGIISLGGSIGYGNRNYEEANLSRWSSNRGFAAVRSAFHYTALNQDKLDVYGGVELGFGIVSTRNTFYNPTTAGLWNYGNRTAGFARLHPFIGARYYLSNNFALMAETSLALFNGVNIGASFDF
jgi:hypothetical protein